MLDHIYLLPLVESELQATHKIHGIHILTVLWESSFWETQSWELEESALFMLH